MSETSETTSRDCPFCELYEIVLAQFQDAIQALRPDHTRHCNARYVYGDRHCECGQPCDCSACEAVPPAPSGRTGPSVTLDLGEAPTEPPDHHVDPNDTSRGRRA